jgi:hypothetical protein
MITSSCMDSSNVVLQRLQREVISINHGKFEDSGTKSPSPIFYSGPNT